MTEKSGEQNVYKMRTMEGDLAVSKRGGPPQDIPVTAEGPKPPLPLSPPPLPTTPRQPETLSTLTPPKPPESLQPKPSIEKPPRPLPSALPPKKLPEPVSLSTLEQHGTPIPPPPPTGGPPALAHTRRDRPSKKPIHQESKKPPRPPKLPSAKKSNLPQPESRRKLVTLVSVAVLIVLVIGFEVWWFFVRPSNVEIPPQTAEELLPAPEAILPSQPEQTEVEEPDLKTPTIATLLNYDRTEVAIAGQVRSSEIAEAIRGVAEKVYQAGSLVFINLVVDDESVRRAVSLDELIDALNITIDANVRTMLNDEYNLFVFQSTLFDQNTCSGAGNSDLDCSGPRLGLVLTQKQGAALKEAVSSWEPSMAQNLQAFVLAQSTIGPGEFLLNDATYKDTPIRYRNFPIDTMTIDYAVVGELLLITTSKSSMFAAIDALP